MSARQPGSCFHCGEAVPPGPPIWAQLGAVQQPMCCFGCKAVAEFIHDNELGAYYAHRTPPSSDAGLRAENSDWAIYDQEDLLTRYVHRDGDIARATVEIGGMYCSACTWLLETALNRVAGVRNVALNGATRRAVITWDASVLSFSGLLAAIATIGFKPSPATAGLASEHNRDEQRSALRRLIVAAAAGMQVMMFAVALYAGDFFGIEPHIERFLRIISLLVCLPIVFYSARPFFANALRGLRTRAPGMDLPVALAITAAFSASTFATLANRGEIYFDSVAMFVLFLGAARYLEMRARHSAEDHAAAMAALLPEVATRLDGDELEVVSVDRLRVGDRVLVRPGDVIPADARVLSGELAIDEALLTGEAIPVLRGPGASIFAGGINRSGTASIEISNVGASTSLAEIGRMIDEAKADRPPVALLADRIAGRFVLAVIAIATLAGLAWLQVSGQRAFEVLLATLVVTCPCALSLATPATLAAAAGRLAKEGIMLVHAEVLEVLAKPVHIIFDKTGTLTEGRPGVDDLRLLRRGLARDECLAIAAELETVSEHVLSRAFTNYREPGRFRMQQPEVIAGAGIAATLDGKRYKIGSAEFVSSGAGFDAPVMAAGTSQTVIYLADDTGPLAAISIADSIRPDADNALRALERLGHQLSIASGDTAQAVARVAATLKIEDWHAALKPEDKLARVARLRQDDHAVVMVGDGINDAPVLAAADASVAIDAGTALARASADAVIPGRRLNSLVLLARTAVRARQILRQNISWAIAYNLAALPLAVSGALAPWMAALGMSLSSLLVVGNALRLHRVGNELLGGEPVAPTAADTREASA